MESTTANTEGLHPLNLNSIDLSGQQNGIYSKAQGNIYLQLYLCCAVIVNLMLLYWEGRGDDLGFWRDWVTQLSENGYTKFNGNYPPLYIHWLYIVSKIYNFLGLPIEGNTYLKHLCQIPVLAFHLGLILIIYKLLIRSCKKNWHFHLAMLITTLNPALLLNGPIWGQIDVIPVVPVILAILVSTSDKYRIVCIPLYCLGLLTKFQMIAFAPVIGIIFFRNIKTHLLGGLISLAVLIVAYLPQILNDNFFESFKLAYINVLHQYGATTMGASNIWILITGNAAPDQVSIINIDNNSLFSPFFKAKNVGMALFTISCITIFTQGIRTLIIKNDAKLEFGEQRYLLFYAMVCATVFFTFLPAMHERYLLPSVIFALVLYTYNPRFLIYALTLSFISTYNLLMTMGIKTDRVWPSNSWIMLGICLYALLELIFSRKWIIFTQSISTRIAKLRGISLFVLFFGLALTNYQLYQKTVIREPSLTKNQIFLSSIPVKIWHQDWGKLQLNKNVNGQILTTDNKRYARGIGTHANSSIEFQLPKNTQSISGLVGLDNDIESASVKFSIWGDHQKLWESKNIYSSNTSQSFAINLSRFQTLQLVVDSIDGNTSDHANWINLILTTHE